MSWTIWKSTASHFTKLTHPLECPAALAEIDFSGKGLSESCCLGVKGDSLSWVRRAREPGAPEGVSQVSGLGIFWEKLCAAESWRKRWSGDHIAF